MILCGAVLTAGCTAASLANQSGFSRFVGFDDFSNFTRSQNESGERVFLSPEIEAAIDWNELIGDSEILVRV